MKNETTHIFVRCLLHDIGLMAQTEAMPVDTNSYKIMQDPNFDAIDQEVWEFKPGDTVKCEQTTFADGVSGPLAVLRLDKPVRWSTALDQTNRTAVIEQTSDGACSLAIYQNDNLVSRTPQKDTFTAMQNAQRLHGIPVLDWQRDL